jgi:adenosylcobinamide kinase / adenosylcobinamide-phosphate guanylyltransferase
MAPHFPINHLMGLVVLLGGARSGRSALAVRMASADERPVVFVATGQARDDEMASRIARHRRERPRSWTTVEEPLDLAAAIAEAPRDAFVIVDCLTLWTANALDAGWSDGAVEQAAAGAAALAAGRRAPTVIVSNEVGMGIVPDAPLARGYRDLLGRVNTLFATAAERACLVVAGRVLELQ